MKIHGNVKDAKGLLENERMAQEARRREELAKAKEAITAGEPESADGGTPETEKEEASQVTSKTKKTRKKKDSEDV